jgi:DNA-cytosine methyltransferase
MIVLSLFDGKACLRIALERAGISVTKYYASEIDKNAIAVAQHNWPDIIQIGDVTKVTYCNGVLHTENGSFEVGHIDLIAGGSPCQGFSFAGRQLNFNDPRSALFFEFVRLKNETSATTFLLENVVMKKEYKDLISEYMGVEPVFINSDLVSGQTRKRLYWSNLPIQQPLDEGILFKNVLQDDYDKKFIHSEKAITYMDRKVSGGRCHWDFKHHSDTDCEKSMCITAVIHKGVPYNVLIDRRFGKVVIRMFTPVELERLQTLPDNYTSCVSNTQRYIMIGNGWTIDVISHILHPLAIINYKPVVFASDCLCDPYDIDREFPICHCGVNYSECSCPSPTQDDIYDYKFINNIMYAKLKSA